MPTKTITLSDGQPSEWRVLELYELDKVPYTGPGEFEYQYTYHDGEKKPHVYTLANWPDGPPERPETPEELCEYGSLEWAMWNRWNLYYAVYSHRLKQIEAEEQHAHDIARYILAECPVNPADRARVTGPDDMDKVYQAVMTVEVGIGDIELALRDVFPGLVWRPVDPEGIAGVAAGIERGGFDPALGGPDPAGVAAAEARMGAAAG